MPRAAPPGGEAIAAIVSAGFGRLGKTPRTDRPATGQNPFYRLRPARARGHQ
jgi:hypothetical protein